MSTRKFRLWGIALLAGVLSVGMGACEGDTILPSPDTPTLTLSPAGPISLTPGQTVQLAASVQNTDGAVSFTSSNGAVASVDGSGLVTANAVGTATITAAVAGTTLAQSVQIVVSSDDSGPPPTGNESVVIGGLTNAQGGTVSRSNVQGEVILQMDVERGNADRLEVFLVQNGERESVCVQTFGGASAQVDAAMFTCSINTADFDENLVARFANGQADIVVELSADGNVLSSAELNDLTLANVDLVSLSVDVDRTAINPNTNQIWAGGDVTVDGAFVSFSGVQPSSISVALIDSFTGPSLVAGPETVEVEDGRFTVTFDEATDLAGVEDDAVAALVGDATTAGGQEIDFNIVWQTAPFQRVADVTVPGQGQASAGIFRYDNVVPATGTGFTAQQFLGGTNISDVFDETGSVDTGVDNVSITYYALEGTGAATAAAVVANGVEFEDVSELDEGSSYRFAARVCDALDNCVNVSYGISAIIDLTAPEITELVYGDGSQAGEDVTNLDILPDNHTFMVATILDPPGPENLPSGFPTAAELNVSAVALDAAGTNCFIGTVTPSGACAPAATGLNPAIDDNAYMSYTITVEDQAGNVSDPISFTILEDQVAPVVTDVDGPSGAIEGGDPISAAATITDNLDLHGHYWFIQYGAGLNLPFDGFHEDDTSFGIPLTTETRVTESYDIFVDAIDFTAGGIGGIFNADGITVTAVDKAGHTNSLTEPFAPITAYTPATATTDVAWSWEIDTSSGNLCISGACAPTVPSSIVVSATATRDQANTTRPFDRVLFYVEAGGEYRLIATAGAPSVTVTGTTPAVRNFTYATTLSGAAYADFIDAAGGAFQVFAVGVTEADGDGLSTDWAAGTGL